MIEAVARDLLGEPSPSLCTKTNLRWGSRGSLSVDVPKGVWQDHEAGIGGGTIDLIQRYKRLDKAAAVAWLAERGHIAAAPPTLSASKRQIAAYDYVDADGEVLFQVVRYAPKDFRQRRPNGRGGWDWNTKGTPRVPYRLPELPKTQASATVFVVEGEKDVDALCDHCLIATCNPGGTGKWSAGFTQ